MPSVTMNAQEKGGVRVLVSIQEVTSPVGAVMASPCHELKSPISMTEVTPEIIPSGLKPKTKVSIAVLFPSAVVKVQTSRRQFEKLLAP